MAWVTFIPSFNTVNGIRVHAINHEVRLHRGYSACFNTVNGIRVHAICSWMLATYIASLASFNTVNGIRVHAIRDVIRRRKVPYCGFNTVNGIRVHAMMEVSTLSALRSSMFQYRKRYKGACNKGYTPLGGGNGVSSFNTVNGIRVHAIWYCYRCCNKYTKFQYRKRYKGACNNLVLLILPCLCIQVSIP